MIVSAQAPGKMILLGEYAVLEGAPAMVCAVNRYARVQAQNTVSTIHNVEAVSLGVNGEPFVLNAYGKVRFNPQADPASIKRLGFFAKLFESLYGRLASGAQGVKLSLDTADFYSQQVHAKLGFGSSAALTVAMASALSKLFEGTLPDKKTVLKLALEAHYYAQGKVGSGIDIAASVYGGILEYRKEPGQSIPEREPQTVPFWNDLFILVVWTGKSVSTRLMISAVNTLKTDNRVLFNSIIRDLTVLSETGIEAYRSKNMSSFMKTIKEYHQTMDRLGKEAGADIVSVEHQALFQLCQADGAAYKPSGAGGGDIGIVFCTETKQVERLERKIAEEGFLTVPISVSTEGMKITYKNKNQAV